MAVYRPRSMSVKDMLEAYSCPEPNTGCWLWQRCVDGYGYGLVKVDGKLHRTHRLSLSEKLGRLSACALHHCDTPSCVNPDHLFEGTKYDNMADKKSKKRAPYGEGNWKHKLTSAEVLEIRDLHKSGRSPGSIAREYGMSRIGIRYVIGEGWEHL